jgi:hypothetical protein
MGGSLQTVVSTNTLAVTAADANNVMNIYKARYQKMFLILIVCEKATRE